ncbi:MAG: HAD family hydrolase [Ilumatobacteraceae bacterium]
MTATASLRFDVVGLDADDTLWHSEDSFHRVEAHFVELVEPYAAIGIDVAAALRATERAQLPIAGYGVKAFTLSMVRAAVTVSDGAVPAAVIGQLLDDGMDMLTEPVRLLPDVPAVLADLGRDHRLVLITKGDLVHQTRKVTTSGIAHHFEHVEVVLEKDADTYAGILRQVGVRPERFVMVGNSVRSDILPVLSLGAHAVHIPYPLLWEHEHVDHDEDLDELTSIAELPQALRGA